MGSVSDEILLARAFLSRVAEPASIAVWKIVCRDGPVEAARAIRIGRVDDRTSQATAARAGSVDPRVDLEAAHRRGIRLVVPESDEWPHFAMAALEMAGERRLQRYERGDRQQSVSGELIPPLALWARGNLDLATVGVRSVALVGSRSATEYGYRIAKELSFGLAARGFVVVSGGAYGIDAAAHRGALAAGGETVLVSAGGLDQAYPPANSGLFEQVVESGLLLSESPPGAAPQRRRFLTRNRLIATLGTGTVVVEAARRSGARNTAGHCVGLGRPLMAVPGPVTSPMSVGCHKLLSAEQGAAQLVTGVDDVLLAIGGAGDLPVDALLDGPIGGHLTDRLDRLDPVARQVFDGFPARAAIGPDGLAATTGVPPLVIIRTLPLLELSGLIEPVADGYRICRPGAAAGSPSGARPDP
jgi:DNA processing protein